MEKVTETKRLKRKRKASSIPDNLKSPNLQNVTIGAWLMIQKVGHKNDQEVLFTPQRTVKMLIRGLGSCNTQVQKNYFAILVALLKSLKSSPELTVSSVLDAITSELHATGHIKKGEEREILIGRVLAFGVLVRSGIIHLATKEEQVMLVTQILQDTKEKSYMPLVGDPFLIDYLKQVEEKLFKHKIWPLLSQEVRPGPDQTLLMYHCLMVCEERFPSVVTSKYLNQTLNSPTALSPATAHGLVEALKRDLRFRTLDHPAFRDIFKSIASSEDLLSSFWQEIETQFLGEATSSYNKQIMAIKIFSIILSQLQHVSQAVTMLTPKLLGWFMKKYRSTGFTAKQLHKVSREALKNLMELCTKTDSAKASYSVLKKLIFNPGSLLFDQLSGSKVVAQLVAQLKEKQVVKLVEVLRDVVTDSRAAVDHKDGGEATRPWTNKEKLYVIHLLCSRLIHNPSTQSDVAWRLNQLTFLFDVGFFPTTNIGVELASSIRDSFFNSFNYKSSSIDELQEVLAGVVEHINKRLSSGDQLRVKVSDKVLPAWNKMYKVAKKLGNGQKHKKEEARLPKVFQTMFYHIGLHLFKEASFATDVLEELHSVYERVDKTSGSEEEPHWTEVVTEMFLSLLSRNSHRHLLGCVFSSFCYTMTPQNIHQILQVLDPTNNTNPLLDQLDTDSESGEEDEGGEEEGDKDEEEESSDDGMTDADDDMEEDMEEKVNDKLRRAVIEALGDTGAMTDTESVDLDNMDENEAKRVDRALSAAFQAFKPSKKKEPSHVKALTHFRSRVLDLVELWMSRTEKPPLDLTVDVMLRLMTLLEHSLVDKHQSPLEVRVRSVIKKLTGSMSKKSFNTEDCKDLHLGNILKSLLDKGERTTTVYMSVHQELIDVTTFIVKVSQQVPATDNDNTDDRENLTVYSVLKDAMNSYFTQRDCLVPIKLFSGLFSLNVPFVSLLASKLPGYAFDPSVPSYRQSKALEFLILFWKNNRLIFNPSDDLLERLKKMSKKLYKSSVKMIEEPKGRVQDKFLNELKSAFKVIQSKNWLSDLDLEEHMKNLKEFHNTITKMRKMNGQNAPISNEAMEVENDKKENQNSKLESATEEENESGDEESASEVDESKSDNDEEAKCNDSANIKDITKGKKEKKDLKEKSQKESEEESLENESEEESEDDEGDLSIEEEEDSEESPSEEEPPSKKAKKKGDKKRSREKLRRIQLLKNNSKKLRMESMSAGLNENVFSKYSLLLNKKTTSPDR